MTKTQCRCSKISTKLASFILASNSPTAAARSLRLEANPAVTRSASNINLMSGLYCPASLPRGLTSHNHKENWREPCVSAVFQCVCCCPAAAELGQWWGRQHQERQRAQQAGAAMAAADDRICVGGSKGIVTPWDLFHWAVWLRWDNIWHPPLSPHLQCYPSRHYTLKLSPCPRGTPLGMQRIHSIHAIKPLLFACNVALNSFRYFELNNQEWHDNYVLGTQRHPMAPRKPKVALWVMAALWVAGLQTPAMHTGNKACLGLVSGSEANWQGRAPLSHSHQKKGAAPSWPTGNGLGAMLTSGPSLPNVRRCWWALLRAKHQPHDAAVQPIHFSLIQPSNLLVELYTLLETEPPAPRTAVSEWTWGQMVVHGSLLFRGINIAMRAIRYGAYEHVESSPLLFQGGRKEESPVPPGSTDRGLVSS